MRYQYILLAAYCLQPTAYQPTAYCLPPSVFAPMIDRRFFFQCHAVPPSGYARFSWRMILSDLPSPAEALIRTMGACEGFAQAGNRYPLFGIMR